MSMLAIFRCNCVSHMHKHERFETGSMLRTIKLPSGHLVYSLDFFRIVYKSGYWQCPWNICCVLLLMTVMLEDCMFSWQVKQAETILAVNHREGSIASAGLPFSSTALCWVWTGTGSGTGHAWMSCGSILWGISTRITRDSGSYS